MTTTSSTTSAPATTAVTASDSASIGSALATALGGGTGVDMTQLATNVANAQFAGQLANIATQNSALTTEISSATQLRSDLLALSSSLGTAVQSGSLSSSPTVANSIVASASLPIGENGAASSYTLEVDSLASPQVLTSSTTYSSATATVGSGSLTINPGSITNNIFIAGTGTPVNIPIASGSTLTDVVNAINGSGAGVTAYLATVGSGVQLVLKGAQGAANAFTLSATEATGDPGLSSLAWDPSTGAASQLAESATDASYKLDGISETSPNNTIASAAPGLALQLTGTNVGNPTTITSSNPSTAIVSAMQSFTTALNAIVTELGTDMAGSPGSSGSGASSAGALRSDLGAQSVQAFLQSLCGQVIMPNAAAGTPATFADLGLSMGESGSFTLNGTVLNAALAANPAAVAGMFTTGANGVYDTMFNGINGLTSTNQPGSLDYSIATYTTNQTNLATTQTTVLNQQSSLRTLLVTQYAATNAQVASDKSTLAFLTDQIASWNNSNSSSSSG
jgi:flagellar hook-associated protein 2